MAQCNPGDDLVLAAAAIALSLSRGMELSELNVLAELTNAVGQNLSVIAAKREACEKTDRV